MSTESNKALIRRHIRAVNERTPEVWDEIMSPAFDHHLPGFPAGRKGYADVVKLMWAAFPDFVVTLEDMLAEDDRIATRFTERGTHKGDFLEIPASGKSYVKGGMTIYRIEDGQMAELRLQEDTLGWLHQLGVELPPPALLLV